MDSRVKDYWNRRYAEEGHIWGDEALLGMHLIRDVLAAVSASSVLLAGAGYGRNARYLARHGFLVEAVDVAPEAVRLARLYSQASGEPGFRVTEADTRHLPFPTAHFDAVVADKLLHLLTPSAALDAVSEWKRVLVPGGLICATAFRPSDPRTKGPQRRSKGVFAWSDRRWRALWANTLPLFSGHLEEPTVDSSALQLQFMVAQLPEK